MEEEHAIREEHKDKEIDCQTNMSDWLLGAWSENISKVSKAKTYLPTRPMEGL